MRLSAGQAGFLEAICQIPPPSPPPRPGFVSEMCGEQDNLILAWGEVHAVYMPFQNSKYGSLKICYVTVHKMKLPAMKGEGLTCVAYGKCGVSIRAKKDCYLHHVEMAEKIWRSNGSKPSGQFSVKTLPVYIPSPGNFGVSNVLELTFPYCSCDRRNTREVPVKWSLMGLQKRINKWEVLITGTGGLTCPRPPATHTGTTKRSRTT